MRLLLFELKKNLSGRMKWMLVCLILANICLYYMALMPSILPEKVERDRSSWIARLEAGQMDDEEKMKHLERISELVWNGTYQNTAQAYDLVQREYESIENYRQFIRELEARADKLMRFSIFSKEGSFARKNIEKTVQDFSDLESLNLKPVYERGVETLQKFYLTDLLMIVSVLLLCFQGSGQDAKKGMVSLLRAAPQGKTSLKMTQMISVWILTLGVGILLYGSSLLMTLIFAAPGDLFAAVQSMTSFRNVSFQWSIKEFLALFLIWKLLASCLVAAVCQVILVIFNGQKWSWVVLGGVYGVSFLQWLYIPDHPVAKIFRYLNPFGILDAGQILGNYQNLNFFTAPVHLLNASIVFIAVVLAAALFFLLKAGTISWRLPEIHLRDPGRIHPRSGVWKFEFYKIFFNQKAWVIVCVVAVSAVWSEAITNRYVSVDDYIYDKWIQEYKGEYTTEKKMRLENLLEGGDYPGDELGSLEMIQVQMQNIEENLEGKGGILHEKNLEYFFFPEENEIRNLMILFVALAVTLSSLFYQEEKSGMQALIRSAPGSRGVYWGKMGAAAASGGFFQVLLWSAYYLGYFIRYGRENLNFSVGSFSKFGDLKTVIPVWGFMIWTMVVRILMGVAAGILMAVMCKYLHAPILNLMGNFMVFVIPTCLLWVGRLPYQNSLVFFINNVLREKLGYIRSFSSWNQMYVEGRLNLAGGLWIFLAGMIVFGASMWGRKRA